MAAKRRKKPAKTAARRRRPSKKKPSLGNQLLRVAVGLVVLIGLVAAAGFLLHHYVVRPAAPPALETAPKAPAQPVSRAPRFEVYPPRDVPVRPPAPEKKPSPAAELPKVALIVDDLGYDRQMARRFLDLEGALTFSILPNGPASRQIAQMAGQRGLEIMVHLPMEPNEYPDIDPGPGALLTSMSADQLIRQLTEHLDALPAARGVNNHMGSKMTAHSEQLYQVFSILKKRGLYFIDSRTSAKTVCRPSARLFQLDFGQRDVFIDHVQEAGFIKSQLRHLVETAESHGEAIGIVHPHRLTAQILAETIPEMKKRVSLVPASAVVHPAG